MGTSWRSHFIDVFIGKIMVDDFIDKIMVDDLTLYLV